VTARVLMTADTLGGVWTYALELVDGLAAHDVEVHLATMGGPLSLDQREAASRSAIASLHESAFLLEWMDDPWTDVDRAGDWLLALAGELEPDVVHLNGYAHGSLAWDVPVVSVAHSDVVSWWEEVRGEPAPCEWVEYCRRVTQGISAADEVVAPTEWVASSIARVYGRRPAVINNGRRSDWVRIELPKQPMIAAAGRVWDEAKNLTAVARVAPRLSWPLVIAGEGADAGPSGQPFLGRLTFDELAVLLARASVFVLPARYEPFGLGPLEAAIAGCALVLGDIPSLREVWDDAALFVDPDDDDALVDALEQLAADGDLRAVYAAKAAERSAMYTVTRMADQYAALYRRLTISRSPKARAS
jgi:glycosyltransferase involved in cell wall biosynthesis